MGMRLQDLIVAAQKLLPRERLDLISAVSRSLQCAYEEADFWKPRSLEQHIRLQGTSVVADIAELRADFWPEEETSDDLIAYIYHQRAEDRLTGSLPRCFNMHSPW